MNRKGFIYKCGTGCLGIFVSSLMLEGCTGTRFINGMIEGSDLLIPENSFLRTHADEGVYRRYIIVQHDALKYPIVVYRHSSADFQAFLMKCTHQGTELRVYGDRLQCPAHGSEFNSAGEVSHGPADAPLRRFPVTKEFETLKINLS